MSPLLHPLRSRSYLLDFCLIAGGSAILVAVVLLSLTLAYHSGEALTRNTVRLSLAWYAVALCLMMRLGPADWLAATRLGRLAR